MTHLSYLHHKSLGSYHVIFHFHKKLHKRYIIFKLLLLYKASDPMFNGPSVAPTSQVCSMALMVDSAGNLCK
jgi:hypothetical protein